MRVLQTIGTIDQYGPTPFRYRREINGIRIHRDGWAADHSVLIENALWANFLNLIQGASNPAIGISAGQNAYFQGPTVAALAKQAELPVREIDPGYFAAILLHEGSVVFYHGQLPENYFRLEVEHPFEARVYLRAAIR